MNQKSIKGGHTSHLTLRTSNRGITLIALVITIIVLLILAGVTISMVLGDDGIIQNAQEAKRQNEISTDKENISLALTEIKTADKVAQVSGTPPLGEDAMASALDTKLEATYGTGKVTVEKENGAWMVTIDGDANRKYPANITAGGTTQTAQWSLPEGDTEVSVGDLVTYKEKTTEQFYVINVTGDNVAMLAAKNITTTGTLEQSDSAPIVAFSNTNYWSSETISNGSLDLNEYTDKTDDEKTSMGVVSTDAIEIARAYGESLGVETGRLMTLEELCSEDIGGDSSNSTTSGCPSFINTEIFWLGSACFDNYVWYVEGWSSALGENSTLGYNSFDYLGSTYIDGSVFGCGVRPVIEVLKSSIE